MTPVVFLDLDGTALGPDGSLFTDAHGLTWQGAAAVWLARRHGIEVVAVSGRTHEQLAELWRALFGRHVSFIGEAGSLLVIDGEIQAVGALEPEPGRSVHRQIAETGAPALLLERFPGLIESHTPWSEGRRASHLFRGCGSIDVAEVNDLLLAGLPVELVDNGVIDPEGLELGIRPRGELRSFHLVPRGASKAAAVRRWLEATGTPPERACSIGDSLLDLEMADVVEHWVVGNGVGADARLAAAVERLENVRVTNGTYGTGVNEVVARKIADWHLSPRS